MAKPNRTVQQAEPVKKVKPVEKVKTKRPPVEEENTEPRYCLSGSGRQIIGKKSKFAIGGDQVLKGRILRGDLDGQASGYDPLSKEAISHAKQVWPNLFDEKGRPILSKKNNSKEREVKAQLIERQKELAKAKAKAKAQATEELEEDDEDEWDDGE